MEQMRWNCIGRSIVALKFVLLPSHPHWGPSGGISKAGGSPEDVEDTEEPLLQLSKASRMINSLPPDGAFNHTGKWDLGS